MAAWPWMDALARLGDAIRNRPTLFNMTKSRFSMDWFYPVLCGAVTGVDAGRRIERHWKKYVVEGLGVRCVSDQPWVTIAESSELVLALAAMGDEEKAHFVFNWLSEHVFDDGSFMSGKVNPHQKEPSSKVWSQIHRKTIPACWWLPMALSASTSSHDSAIVTQGWSETQRTPRS